MLLASGCAKPPPPPPPPLEVGVLVVATTPVVLTQELPGRVSAFFVAQVDARVSGIVQKRLFTEGALVHQGDLLYQIDPAPYEALLKNAEGTLQTAEANVVSTRALSERYGRLVASGAIDRQDLDNAIASYHAYQGAVVSDAGMVQTAKINLGYTRIVAPVSGRIGISQVTPGAYVQDGAATLMATVQQLDPVYVDVIQTSAALLKLRRELASGKLKSDGGGHLRVKLVLEDGTRYPYEGTLKLSDVTVSTTTSTVTVRCIFPNPHEELLPGMFVRARLDAGSTPDAILVPQLAVTHNTKGEPTAMVVGKDDQVEVRILETSRAVGNQWLVAAGLHAGDQLIVDNLQKIRPHAVVKTVLARLPALYLPGGEAPE